MENYSIKTVHSNGQTGSKQTNVQGDKGSTRTYNRIDRQTGLHPDGRNRVVTLITLFVGDSNEPR